MVASLGGRRRPSSLAWAEWLNSWADLAWGETKKTGWAGWATTKDWVEKMEG
jgi:hypothetical protein